MMHYGLTGNVRHRGIDRPVAPADEVRRHGTPARGILIGLPLTIALWAGLAWIVLG